MRWAYFLSGGVALGCIAWILLPADLPLGSAARFERPPRATARVDAVSTLLIRLDAAPSASLFPAAPSPSATPSMAVTNLRLHGTSQSPGRRAALISANGATAQWVVFGQASAELELLELSASKAVVRTNSGETVTLDLFKAQAEAGQDPTADAAQ